MNTWGPGIMSLRMHFITDENNETALHPAVRRKDTNKGKRRYFSRITKMNVGPTRTNLLGGWSARKKSSKGKAEGAEVEVEGK